MAVINGSNGDNLIEGTNGADVINGKAGDDVIIAGGSADFVDGGAGADIISGGGGSDVIYGGAGADLIDSGSGSDFIDGGAGADLIDGGSGDDIIQGRAGADVLEGGSGDDVIDGGAGSDVLSGGSGADTFLFSGNAGDDIITDFRTADTIAIDLGEDYLGDVDLSALDFEQSGAHVLITLPNGSSILVQNATIAAVQARVQVACLLRGTAVATPDGEMPVEGLAIGDRVTTLGGEPKRIKWIGRRAYGAGFVRGNMKVVPVLIAAGALGPSSPSRDLYVSPDHAVYVDGGLVAAERLVNGGSIRRAHEIEAVEYFHIEFETPEVIFTNGAPTESYVDHGNRRMFQNYQEFLDLYGEPLADGSVRERRFPLLTEGTEIEALRGRLGRAAA